MQPHAVGQHVGEPRLEALGVEPAGAYERAQVEPLDKLRKRRRAADRHLASLALVDVPRDGGNGDLGQPLVLGAVPVAGAVPHASTVTRSSSRARLEGHQIFGPISSTSDGTSTLRTRKVSSRTPNATTNPISVRNTSGSTASTEKVPA